MMDNKIYNIGDVLIINVNPQISGRVKFSEYSDVWVGETATRSLRREFRVSPDNVFWSNWQLLTNENLSESSYVTDNSLSIQLRYTRTGTDTTGELEFKDVNFMGEREEILFVAPTLSSSIFASIVGTNELKVLEENIFKKLYYRGILPKYITRADNSDENEDKDFIDLFFSVARYFSLFIRFFKRFENFRNDFDLMIEQVRQSGLYFDEANITLEELQYLAQHTYDQIRQRGTEMIFKRKGYELPNGMILEIDGEFIRLVRSKVSDELLYENIPLNKVGWCMKQSSPMYRGTSQSYFLNKTPEDTQNFEDLNNFLISKTSQASVDLLKLSDGKQVISMKTTFAGQTMGLGRMSDDQSIPDDAYIVVDPKLDYEITFAFQIASGAEISGNNLTFGVEGFDVMKNKLDDSFVMPNGESVSENFFIQDTKIWKRGTWYYARGIIHAYSTINTEIVPTNLGIGNNLYFNNSFVKYIVPKILFNVGSTAIYPQYLLWDYKIRPLVRGRNILPLKNGEENSTSLGFIQSSRIFYAYVRNNNNSQSQDEITDIIEKYLLPYNVTDIFVFMSNY